jgi:hypothetical protein
MAEVTTMAGPDTHCCDQMKDRLADNQTAIQYWPKFREYRIPVLDGGDSVITIQFCPWCGIRLPKSLRTEWFDRLDGSGWRSTIQRYPPPCKAPNGGVTMATEIVQSISAIRLPVLFQSTPEGANVSGSLRRQHPQPAWPDLSLCGK